LRYHVFITATKIKYSPVLSQVKNAHQGHIAISEVFETPKTKDLKKQKSIFSQQKVESRKKKSSYAVIEK